MEWICVRQCFQFGLLWEFGDIAVSEENLGSHFVPFEGIEGFALTGRKFLIEGSRITGVWDGPE